ncbi:MAG: hypothetical protein WBQ08_14730 [Candidatus Sulfotelmatobacter sp.]
MHFFYRDVIPHLSEAEGMDLTSAAATLQQTDLQVILTGAFS